MSDHPSVAALRDAIAVVGAERVDRARLVRPSELPSIEDRTLVGVAQTFHALLHFAHLDARFTIDDDREESDDEDETILSVDLDDGALELTVWGIGTTESTRDDVATEVAFAASMIAAENDKALADAADDVPIGAVAVALGFGLVLARHIDEPSEDDEPGDYLYDWFALLAVWHRMRGEVPDAELDLETRTKIEVQMNALPPRAELREVLGLPVSAGSPATVTVPPLSPIELETYRAIDEAKKRPIVPVVEKSSARAFGVLGTIAAAGTLVALHAIGQPVALALALVGVALGIAAGGRMKRRFCGTCSTLVEPGAQTCASCGARLKM